MCDVPEIFTLLKSTDWFWTGDFKSSVPLATPFGLNSNPQQNRQNIYVQTHNCLQRHKKDKIPKVLPEWQN